MTSRGDNIISRNFRGNHNDTTKETFMSKVKLNQELASVFTDYNLIYVWTKNDSLYFLVTMPMNAAPSIGIDFLGRCQRAIRDFLGTCTEDILRKNFIMV